MSKPAAVSRFDLSGAVSLVDITPPIGIALHNWAHSGAGVSTGVHRPLLATLMAWEMLDGQRSLIVALDLGWWMSDDDEYRLRSAVLTAARLAPEVLVLSLTHTHSGPSLSRDDAGRPGGHLIADYLDHVARIVADAAERIFERVEPGFLEWTTGRCSLAVNRDLWREDERRYVVGANPDVAADDTLLVGRFSRQDGTVVAILANYAVHPTSLGGGNLLVSPDLVGAAREVVTEACRAPLLFLQGASGDLSPRDQYSSSTDTADNNGRILGHAIVVAALTLPRPGTTWAYDRTVESGAPLGFYRRVPAPREAGASFRTLFLKLPSQCNTPAASADPEITAERALRADRIRERSTSATTEFPVTVWRLGSMWLFAYPGEAYSELQIRLRFEFPALKILFVNLANGHHRGYLASSAAYDDARYPAWQSPLGRGSLEILIDACRGELRAATTHHHLVPAPSENSASHSR